MNDAGDDPERISIKVLMKMSIKGESRYLFELDTDEYSFYKDEQEVLLYDGYACEVVNIVEKDNYWSIECERKRLGWKGDLDQQ